ncbi:Uncharacterised protein [Serratia rubidaea]|nr:Uncharacterised protein [Serratia rubidaea]
MISILLDVGTILSFLAIFIGFLTMIFFGINRKNISALSPYMKGRVYT